MRILLFTTLAVLSANISAETSFAGVSGGKLRREAPRILIQRHGSDDTIEVVRSDAMSQRDVEQALNKLRSRTDLAYAVVDQRRQAHAVPSDALHPTQWYLQNAETAAIAANLAWDTTTGGNGTIVAVLDTGVRYDHPDLLRAAQNGKLLPGFDFVSGESTSSFLVANDGDGWDADPSDPGDWVDSVDKQRTLFSLCSTVNSSWHGTRVAGLIGAASNNGVGIAGVSWGALILPVRVLGKCGGYDADILPAMRWAAGLHVSGVPDNPYPAKILNLSFGSPGSCNAAYQTVLQQLAAIGVTVIVSAGNEGGPVDAPANCPLAVGVSGLRHAGTKVGYSSLGPEVAIAAPAGNCSNLTGACLFSLNTTYDVGTTIPAGSDYTNQSNTNLGTSFSAPLVAGVAALMHSVNGKLSTTQMRARLQEGAHAFPMSADPAVSTCHVPTGPNDFQRLECNCTTNTCGTGMLHAPTAIVAAQRPIANIVAPANFVAGSTITLDATVSSAACQRTIVGYQWSVIATGTSAPTLSPDNQASIQITAPLIGSYTLRVVVTDDQGATDSGTVIVNDASTISATETVVGNACPAAVSVAQQPQVTAPSSETNSSSGGGLMTWQWLGLLLCVMSISTTRRKQV